jgi:hypothetical protein
MSDSSVFAEVEMARA